MPDQHDTRPLSPPPEMEDKPLNPSPLPDTTAQSRWVVRFVATDQSIPIQLPIDNKALIGRSDPDTSFMPNIDLASHGALDKGVSRRHAEIRAGKDYLVLIDLHSTNGTRINGHTLLPNEPYRLNHDDTVEFGTMEFQMQISVTPVHAGVKLIKSGTGLLGRSDDDEKTRARRLILIVDDDIDTAHTFASMVEALGYDFEILHRTGDAMRFIAQEVPDCVLVDLHMPDYPGTEICRMIKNDLANVYVPIFVISGETDEAVIEDVFTAGADVFLSKPPGMDELMRGLRRFVGNPIIDTND